MDEINERVRMFAEMLRSINSAYLTVYAPDFRTLFTTAENPDIMQTFLRLGADDQMVTDIFETSKAPESLSEKMQPLLFTTEIGLSWISETLVKDRKIQQIHILGPAFLDDINVIEVGKKLEKLNLSVRLKHVFMDYFKDVPIVTLARFQEYGIMMHYCITGERVSLADFDYPTMGSQKRAEQTFHRSHTSYRDEQRLLALVEEGNLNYRDVFADQPVTMPVGRISSREFLRQEKDMVIAFTVLCSRAAIRGGLASDTAMTLCDRYIEHTENMTELAQLLRLRQEMFGDFVRRVHTVRARDSEISPQIRKVCDHIRLYPEQAHSISSLAEMTGYTDYYFSNKFKKETGMSVRDFVMQAKIDHAKTLLLEPETSVADVAEALGFSSQSHFGSVFRRIAGMTPTEFQETNGSNLRP